MTWLTTRPLALQLVVLVVGAIVFSQVFSLFFFVNERRSAFRDAGIYQAVFRAATIAKTLDAIEEDVDRQILRVSSNRRLRYWKSNGPAVVSPEALPMRDRALTALQERYPEFANSILFQRGAGELPPKRRRPPRPEGGPPRPDGRPPPPIPIITLSVPLTDGGWLNGVVFQQPLNPPLGWRPAASLALMVFSIIAALLYLISRVTRPLSDLADAADRLGRGEQVGPVTEQGPREVRITTKAFNAMQERLGRFVTDRTRMLAAISHDLRTPITALRLRAELLDEGETRDRMLETLDDMATMTEATLNFIRDDASTEETTQVDITALIESTCEDFKDMGKPVKCRAIGRVIYACRSTGIKRAVTNLIDNACKYGTDVSVELQQSVDGIDIVVADNGPGIPDDVLDQMFEPFSRLDDARNTENGSVGLGLSIAQTIVRSHGGDVVLKNRREGGLEATIHLPA